MPIKKVEDEPSESESEFSGPSSSGDVERSDSSLYGSLKTSLCWDMAAKRLHGRARQFLETDQRVEIKYNGQLDTNTGAYHFKAHLRKNLFLSSSPSIKRVFASAAKKERGQPLDGEDDVKEPGRLLPAGAGCLLLQDWVLSPGLSFDSGRQQPLKYALTLRKSPQVLLHGPRTDLWLSGRAIAELDTSRSAQLSTSGAVKLKLIKYGVTTKQDLKVSLGLEWQPTGSGGRNPMPYIKIAENQLAVKLQAGKWLALYEL